MHPSQSATVSKESAAIKSLTAKKTGPAINHELVKGGHYETEVTDQKPKPSMPSTCPMSLIEPPQSIGFQFNDYSTG